MDNYKLFVMAFLLVVVPTFAIDVSVKTDDYVYSINESIYASVLVSQNNTAITNQSVVLTIKNVDGISVVSKTLTTNSTGGANYTFSLSSAGNYTIHANVSGTVVGHFIKVLSYSGILVSLNKASYTTSSVAALSISVIDINGNGVSGINIMPTLRYKNGTLISTITSCTTDPVGKCSTSFTVPSTEGEYILEINNFEESVLLLVGGFGAFMKISPSVVGKGDNVTVRVSVKNANGNGIAASTRQLVITAPNGTTTTVAAMTQGTDSSGIAITGVYQNTFTSNLEGKYNVVVTLVPQGSNLSKELLGSFEVRAYVIEIGPWEEETIFYPGSAVALSVNLKNASSGDNMAGKASVITSGIKIFDPSGVDSLISPAVSDQVSTTGKYKMTFNMSSTSSSGIYKVTVNVNDSYGSGSANGYFSIQLANGKASTFDSFPNGVSTREFVAGKQIVVRFSAGNRSGAVAVTGISTYNIVNRDGVDKTSSFGTNATYTSGNNAYINLTAPKNGGDYFIRAKVSTPLGEITAEGKFTVNALDVSIRPASVGGGGGAPSSGGPGPGYFWFFRPNDTVQLQVTVRTASEKEGHEGFMSKGSFGGGPSGIEGGLFGIGGGSNVQGAQITLTKLINLNTEEDWTSSITLTNCVTDTSGSCTVSLKSNVNSQNWTGGFYIAFVNVSTSDNKTDNAEGFFEIRRFFMDVFIRANTSADASQLGFTSFNSWNVGPNTAINVSVTVRQPGVWQQVTQSGNLTIQGAFYGGTLGEFIFPPRKIDGTNASLQIVGGGGKIISPPSGGWKSGFYVVKVMVNISGQIDTGEGFFFSKAYEGFAQPVNNQTNVPDFTANSNENLSFKVDVFDVVRYTPGANLTVSLNKILSFADFPPSQLSYDKAVSQGTTGSDGRVIMTVPAPSGGWSTGHYLVLFDVTNGTVTDQIEGFFMVKNFFTELSTTNWRYGRSDIINFTATISSDPSWMRNQFGGGCPPADTTCGGSMGGGAPQGPQAFFQFATVNFSLGYDMDGDNKPDINITNLTVTRHLANLSAVSALTGSANTTIAFMGCANATGFGCHDSSEVTLPGFAQGHPFDAYRCSGANYESKNRTSYRSSVYMNANGSFNGSSMRFYCVNTTNGKLFKLAVQGPGGMSGENVTNWSIEYIQDLGESGGVGGNTGISFEQTSGVTYYNSTLRSLKIVKFSFDSGETVLQEGVHYNLTTNNNLPTTSRSLLIPGVGVFKLKPLKGVSSNAANVWDSGDYFMVAEFNNSFGTEKAEWGFKIETFFVNCYRPSWGDVSSNSLVNVTCTLQNPSSGAPYTGSVESRIETITNSFTGVPVSSSLWADQTTAGNRYSTGAQQINLTINQSLPTGSYQAVIKTNESSDAKSSYIWFEIRDFTPFVFTERWSYGSRDNVTINVQGTLGGSSVSLNLTNSSGTPELVVYKYDRSTWARTTVSGISIAYDNRTYPGRLVLNLSRSSGWEEGNYEVLMNLSRVDAAGSRISGGVQANTWFEVRLFDVWAWSDFWSNHPKSNASLKVFVGSPSGGGYYSGSVTVNVQRIENTITGATLTNGTDYSVSTVIANPSQVGNINVTVVPLGSGLPVGQYKAKLTVTDSNGNSAFAEAWFNVVAFYLSAYSQNYEIAGGENVTINLYASSPSGSFVNLSDANITRMGQCNNNNVCNEVTASQLNYSIDRKNSRININNSGLSQGFFWIDIRANDTQGTVSTTGASFRLTSFAITGRILSPYEFTGETNFRYQYYVNESMRLNVTGTPGVNITNATFRYWICEPTCTERSFVINLSTVIGSTSKATIEITPTGTNRTWVTFTSGHIYYEVIISGVKDGSTSTYFTYGGVSFLMPSSNRVTGLSEIGLTDAINTTFNITIDSNGDIPFKGVNITVKSIKKTSTDQDVNTAPNNWTVTLSQLTDNDGKASFAVTPAGSFRWPVGELRVEYLLTYGNATTVVSRTLIVAQKNLRIDAKSIYNTTNVSTLFVSDNQRLGYIIGNSTHNQNFNISVTIGNPSGSTVNANVTISLPKHAVNTSIFGNNLSNITYSNYPITTAGRTFVSVFNVTLAGNWTGTITVVPASDLMSVVTTSYGFESR